MKKEITIGQHPDNDLVLSGKYIADYHAHFSIIDEKVTVEDLKSTFGTHVNGSPIQQVTLLSPNDRVKVGNQLIDWESFLTEEKETDTPLYWQDLKDLFHPVGIISWTTYKNVLPQAIGIFIAILFAVPAGLYCVEDETDIYLTSSETIEMTLWPIISLFTYIFLNLTQKMLKGLWQQ